MIAGSGLRLTLPRAEHRARWVELMSDPLELALGLPAFVDPVTTVDDLDDVIATAAMRFARREPIAFVMIDDNRPDHLLGTIGWRWGLDERLAIADIGYAVHPDARGLGLAGRALTALTGWLMDDASGPRLPRVQLDHSTENQASCRVALAGGFEKEGVRRHFLPLRDPTAPGGVRRHDVCLHGRVAPAPSAATSPPGQPGS